MLQNKEGEKWVGVHVYKIRSSMKQSQLKLSNGNIIVLLLFLPLSMSQCHRTKSQKPQTTKKPPPTSFSGINPFHHKPAVQIRNLENTRNNSTMGMWWWWPAPVSCIFTAFGAGPLVSKFLPLQVLELTVLSPASSLPSCEH